jgi:hypothetical protein
VLSVSFNNSVCVHIVVCTVKYKKTVQVDARLILRTVNVFCLSPPILQLYCSRYVILEPWYPVTGHEGPEGEQSYSSTVSGTSP